MKALPYEPIVYFGDTARCPYGPRDLDEVRRFVLEITDHLVSEGVKLIVIACNTGTAAGLEDARRAHPEFPVIGVIEPGVRDAAAATQRRIVGVIGTVGTVSSGAYAEAMGRVAPDVRVVQRPCPEFVEFVERGEVAGPRITELARRYLAPLLDQNIDTLILGCTHYPLLEDVLARVAGPTVTIVSSARSTAREVVRVLSADAILRRATTPPDHRFLSTGTGEVFLRLGRAFLGAEVGAVECVRLPSAVS